MGSARHFKFKFNWYLLSQAPSFSLPPTASSLTDRPFTLILKRVSLSHASLNHPSLHSSPLFFPWLSPFTSQFFLYPSSHPSRDLSCRPASGNHRQVETDGNTSSPVSLTLSCSVSLMSEIRESEAFSSTPQKFITRGADTVQAHLTFITVIFHVLLRLFYFILEFLKTFLVWYLVLKVLVSCFLSLFAFYN